MELQKKSTASKKKSISGQASVTNLIPDPDEIDATQLENNDSDSSLNTNHSCFRPKTTSRATNAMSDIATALIMGPSYTYKHNTSYNRRMSEKLDPVCPCCSRPNCSVVTPADGPSRASGQGSLLKTAVLSHSRVYPVNIDPPTVPATNAIKLGVAAHLALLLTSFAALLVCVFTWGWLSALAFGLLVVQPIYQAAFGIWILLGITGNSKDILCLVYCRVVHALAGIIPALLAADYCDSLNYRLLSLILKCAAGILVFLHGYPKPEWEYFAVDLSKGICSGSWALMMCVALIKQDVLAVCASLIMTPTTYGLPHHPFSQMPTPADFVIYCFTISVANILLCFG